MKKTTTVDFKSGWYKTSILLSTVGIGSYHKKAEKKSNEVMNESKQAIMKSEDAITNSKDILDKINNRPTLNI